MSSALMARHTDMRYVHSFREAPIGLPPMTAGEAKKPACTSWIEAAAPCPCTASVSRRSPGRISSRIHSSSAKLRPSGATAA